MKTYHRGQVSRFQEVSKFQGKGRSWRANGLEWLQGEHPLACPYFIPTEPHARELWAHRRRLPQGDGFAGRCAARADACCGDESLRLHCNLGYAEMGSAGCVHLPAEREFDAVRFCLSGEGRGAIRVQFACERGHRPAWCGELRYDRAAGKWIAPPDARLKPLAEAAVRAWMDRQSETL